MTGVQALECKAPDLLLTPGKVQRREFEYIRHGTQTLIVNPDVVTGQVVSPTCSDTRAVSYKNTPTLIKFYSFLETLFSFLIPAQTTKSKSFVMPCHFRLRVYLNGFIICLYGFFIPAQIIKSKSFADPYPFMCILWVYLYGLII